jgi:hypothetical protein
MARELEVEVRISRSGFGGIREKLQGKSLSDDTQ